MASDKSKSLMDTAAEIAEVVIPQVSSVLAAAFSSNDETATGTDADPTPSSPPSKPHRKRAGTLIGLLILGGIAAVAAIIWKRMHGGSASDNWESSYTPPTPTETPAETPTAAEAAEAGGDLAGEATGTQESGEVPDES